MMKAMTAACHGLTGVIHQSDVPSGGGEDAADEARHVLLGLITGAIFVSPASLPHTYCSTSIEEMSCGDRKAALKRIEALPSVATDEQVVKDAKALRGVLLRR